MLKIAINQLLENFLVAVYDENSEVAAGSLNDVEIDAHVKVMIEECILATNTDEEDGVIWDIVHRFEKLLNTSFGVERACFLVYDQVMSYRRRNQFDPRLMVKPFRMKIKPEMFIFVKMDLDATLLKYAGTILDEKVDIEELVSENPTLEQLGEIARASERESED